MKSFLIHSISLILLAGPAFGEMVLFEENFESGGSSFSLNTSDLGGASQGAAGNHWTVNNVYTGGSGSLVCLGFPFTFTVNNTPLQPAGISSPNGNYLHMVSQDAENNSIFNANIMPADGICQIDGTHHFAEMSEDISTTGKTDVTLNFWWLFGGSATTYGEVYYSTNSGTSWHQVIQPLSHYVNQTSWTEATLTNQAFDNQATLRFGFRTVNNVGSTGADPGFALDDIRITAIPEPLTAGLLVWMCGVLIWIRRRHSALLQ